MAVRSIIYRRDMLHHHASAKLTLSQSVRPLLALSMLCRRQILPVPSHTITKAYWHAERFSSAYGSAAKVYNISTMRV